jgi:apolipoprotein D and lipocalin family protein
MSYPLAGLLIMVAMSMTLLIGCASVRADSSEQEVVDYVDVERYLGTWYEIASFPLRAQRDCVGTTAVYGRRSDGKISVYNRCLAGSFEGKVKDIEGKAWVEDTRTNARLKVQFFWPFRAPYWIVDLDEDYQWAVVSAPGKRYLWILSRTPCMDQALFDTLYAGLKARGYDMSRLQSTRQRDAKGTECRVKLP